MDGLFDIYNIIFLVLAVAIFLRLRSVLGRRTGNERPPAEYRTRENGEATATARGDNVVTMPGTRGADVPVPAPVADSDAQIAKVAPEGTPLNDGLKAVAAADRGFDPPRFIEGARAAYEMIVMAFAAGDRKALKPLLSKEVFDGFSAAIADRESRGEKAESTFVGIDKAEIVDAQLKGDTAQLTVRFRSELISLTRAKDGTVVDGDPNKVVEVVDVWTFARDVGNRDPNWKLVATESAE